MPSSHASEEGAGGASTAEATELEKRCAGLEKRAEELEDRYKRALADRDNYRKRTDREVARRVEEGRDALALEWLEAMDSVERAMLMGEPDSSLAVGLQAVMDQMQAILERQGLRRIGRRGERFDPERHEAVAVHVSDEVPDQAVLEVVRPGYAAGERVIRPAQVIVARHEERED
jgi:molecular chaperone GrpE